MQWCDQLEEQTCSSRAPVAGQHSLAPTFTELEKSGTRKVLYPGLEAEFARKTMSAPDPMPTETILVPAFLATSAAVLVLLSLLGCPSVINRITLVCPAAGLVVFDRMALHAAMPKSIAVLPCSCDAFLSSMMRSSLMEERRASGIKVFVELLNCTADSAAVGSRTTFIVAARWRAGHSRWGLFRGI